MGHILNDGTIIEFDDRTLTHIQIIIVQKFTRNESFLMSWKDSMAVGDGRGSAWLAPSIPLYFKFLGGRVPDINENWLLTLAKSAESSTALVVTGEHGELVEASTEGKGYPGDIKRGRTPRAR